MTMIQFHLLVNLIYKVDQYSEGFESNQIAKILTQGAQLTVNLESVELGYQISGHDEKLIGEEVPVQLGLVNVAVVSNVGDRGKHGLEFGIVREI